MNLVEITFDEQRQSPCRFGNIAIGHACYCHHPDGLRKCPIWRTFGEDISKWHASGDWNQDSWNGGCPLFKPSDHYQYLELLHAAEKLREHLLTIMGIDIPDSVWEPFVDAINKCNAPAETRLENKCSS